MFSMFDDHGEPGANCPSHDGARQDADGPCTHRHRGPLPSFFGGSWYVVMSMDSASRLQHPYGTRSMIAAAIPAVMKRFIVDTGVPRAFWSDNGAKITNH